MWSSNSATGGASRERGAERRGRSPEDSSTRRESRFRMSRSPSPQDSLPPMKTDGQGRFTLALDRDRARWQMWPIVVLALDPNHDRAASIDLEEDATNANLAMKSAWRVTGRVNAPDGTAIANARLEVLFRGSPLPSPWGKPAATDSEGRFEIRGLPTGRSFELKLSANGFSGERIWANAPETGAGPRRTGRHPPAPGKPGGQWIGGRRTRTTHARSLGALFQRGTDRTS